MRRVRARCGHPTWQQGSEQVITLHITKNAPFGSDARREFERSPPRKHFSEQPEYSHVERLSYSCCFQWRQRRSPRLLRGGAAFRLSLSLSFSPSTAEVTTVRGGGRRRTPTFLNQENRSNLRQGAAPLRVYDELSPLRADRDGSITTSTAAVPAGGCKTATHAAVDAQPTRTLGYMPRLGSRDEAAYASVRVWIRLWIRERMAHSTAWGEKSAAHEDALQVGEQKSF